MGSAFQRIRARSGHAGVTRMNELSADVQRSGARVASGLRRLSQVPVLAETTPATGPPSPATRVRADFSQIPVYADDAARDPAAGASAFASGRSRVPPGVLGSSPVLVPATATRPTGFPAPAEESMSHRLQPERPDGGSAGPVRPSTAPAPAPALIFDLLRDSGQPLAAQVRQEMETRLGADFSGVRVHTDSAARASAVAVGARAYTLGDHVVIGEGGADKHTLAHELTHVIQQRQGPVAGTDLGDGLKVSDPLDVYERAAEANAARVMRAPVRTHLGHASAADSGSRYLRVATWSPPSVATARSLSPSSHPLVVQRGAGTSKPGTATQQYYLLRRNDVDYEYQWSVDTEAQGRVEAYARRWEEMPVGYVSFSFENKQQVAAPGQNAPFTGENILGRAAGRVCRVGGLYNISLTRPGPANIFSGFADTLMDMAERKARERGATLMYLEPAVSEVRKSPNNNEKEDKDPYRYYTRLGFEDDPQARAHNLALFEQLAGPAAVVTEKQKQGFHEAQTGRILVKHLH